MWGRKKVKKADNLINKNLTFADKKKTLNIGVCLFKLARRKLRGKRVGVSAVAKWDWGGSKQVSSKREKDVVVWRSL